MQWLISLLLLIAIIVVAYLSQKAAVVDWGGKRINCIDGLLRLICKHVHRLKDTSIPLPETGPAIVVSNHVSGLDPFLLIAASRRPLRFLVAREEYNKPILHWLFKASGCIPVDRSGRPEQALRQALRALQSGEVVALFPHGKIHLDDDPPRRIKGGFARLSAWSDAAIYPVRIDGVGGEGKTVLAPIIPSHVTLTVAEPLHCDADKLKDCLDAITAVIERPVSKPHKDS